MKRLFILSQWMETDGVEASLLGLLKEFDYTQVSVDLFLTLHQGPWMREIPKEVYLLPPHPAVVRYASGLAPLRQRHAWLAYGLTQLSRYLAGFWYRLIRRQKVDEIGYEQIRYAVWAPFLPRWVSDRRYDLALIFGGPPGFSRRVHAPASAVWVHTDWAHYRPLPWLARRQFHAARRVVNVSEGAKAAFDRICRLPSGTPSVVVENLLSPSWAHARAEAGEKPQPFEGLKILTVGRVSPPKNPPRALAAAQELKRRGLRFRWFFVGGGECLEGLRQLHAKSGLGDAFVITGPTDNPYPYYPWCDLYVCTSDWEGKSVSVREAQIFAKPTIITRYPTSGSQLEDGVDGLIVDRTPEAIADAIQALSNDPNRREALSAACRARDYANLCEIETILSWASEPHTSA